jgi:hypothetical protein
MDLLILSISLLRKNLEQVTYVSFVEWSTKRLSRKLFSTSSMPMALLLSGRVIHTQYVHKIHGIDCGLRELQRRAAPFFEVLYEFWQIMNMLTPRHRTFGTTVNDLAQNDRDKLTSRFGTLVMDEFALHDA